MNDDQPLAILGGPAVCPQPLTAPPWPPVSDATADRLREVFLSGQWSFDSPAEQAFERAFADHHGAAHAVLMANGTVTLQCALTALGVGAGDEVIVPALTWMATAMAVHYVGATPVFVDVEPDTLCLDPRRVCAALTDATRAVIPVHLYSATADLDELLIIARSAGIAVIEDCAHAHGTMWRGRGVGSWGDIGSFSFQQTKTMTSGEGGVCLTNDDALAERLFRLKHIGYNRGNAQGDTRTPPPAGLVCHNYRCTAFQAVILSDQLTALPDRLKRYRRAIDRLAAQLADVEGVRLQSPGRAATRRGCYALPIVFDAPALSSVPAAKLREAIFAEGLGLAGTYGPVYRHKLYNIAPHRYRIAEGRCPVAEELADQHTLCLPHPWLGGGEATIDRIASILRKIVNHADALAHACQTSV